MENFIINTVFNLNFNIIIAALSTTMFLFNVLILRLRKAYLPINGKHIPLFLVVPVLNMCFLLLNTIILTTNVACYTIRKKRCTKSTYKYHLERERRKKTKIA